MLQWRLFLEDFGVKLSYIKGETNHLVDALLHLPFQECDWSNQLNTPSPSIDLPNELLDTFYSVAIDDDDLLDCFINLLTVMEVPFVLDYKIMQDAQCNDAPWQVLLQKFPKQYVQQQLTHNVQLHCHIKDPQAPWKIYLPTLLLDTAVKWCHLALGHAGQNNLCDTIQQHLHHPNLCFCVEKVVTTCNACQRQSLTMERCGRGFNWPLETHNQQC